MEEGSVSLDKDLCLYAELQFSFCSLPKLRQGEGFRFFNFLSSIVCTDVQHPYLGKPYVVCVVMALVPR